MISAGWRREACPTRDGATGARWDQAGGRGFSTSLASPPGGRGALQGTPPCPRGASRLVYMPLVLPRLRLQLYIFLMVQYLPKNCKIKRDPIAGEDSIIIRVNLIRHIIFRNLQLRLIKYLYQSLLDTRSGKELMLPTRHFRVCKNVTGALEAGAGRGASCLTSSCLFLMV